MKTAIEFQSVSKQFHKASKKATDGISFQVQEGELVTILGSSGCGKTTLLKMVNRLYDPDEGKILVDGEDLSKMNPMKIRRNIGYVIQQSGLFPHMTIEENIFTVPKLLKWGKNRMKERCKELLELVGLSYEEYRKRYPAQLSGGQQQRVGLARALAANPKLMLMDEPFGAIDAIQRMNLQDELLRIHKETKKTILFVTHDINEAFKLGNRVMIMNEGKIVRFDTPENIVNDPRDPFAKSLVDSARAQEEFWREKDD